jgi:CO dehydrogenase maturation factor
MHFLKIERIFIMKIAISGKGGVGKTTFAAFLIKSLQKAGKKVLAIDADPDANLAQALGAKNASEITPISKMRSLIEERTDSKVGTMGGFFKINPKVSDLPEKLSIDADGVKLMVLGGVKAAEGGCICPESVLLKVLVTHLILFRDEVIILDMEAGLEHLGRGTARAVDKMIVVVEPGRRSMETANEIKRLSEELGIKDLLIVGNKIRSQKDKDFLLKNMEDFNFLGFLPFNDNIIEADLDDRPPYELSPDGLEIVSHMIQENFKEN